MVLVVSAIFASAFMMVTVYLHLYRLHPHVHRNYNRGCAMSTGLTSTRPSRKNIFGRNFLENYQTDNDHGNYEVQSV